MCCSHDIYNTVTNTWLYALGIVMDNNHASLKWFAFEYVDYYYKVHSRNCDSLVVQLGAYEINWVFYDTLMLSSPLHSLVLSKPQRGQNAINATIRVFASIFNANTFIVGEQKKRATHGVNKKKTTNSHNGLPFCVRYLYEMLFFCVPCTTTRYT